MNQISGYGNCAIETIARNCKSIKLVVVGDGTVGKTSLLLRYTQNEFMATEYVPTILDEVQAEVVVDDELVKLELWDTAGNEAYDCLRTIAYKKAVSM